VTDETSEQGWSGDLDDPDGILGRDDPDGILGGTVDGDEADLLADAEEAMASARARLAEVPAEVVITNHVMGLYELAAIHLSAAPPDLAQAALAIDALANIRLAFVQIKGQPTASDV
jgi:hypothetical protein